jgi:hypothetical protein
MEAAEILPHLIGAAPSPTRLSTGKSMMSSPM